ncbi:MAG: recombinase family protein [Defluviitaleaceae bacterium]|nr:recombinase family protein [Defluviitaleaceae bacterium]
MTLSETKIWRACLYARLSKDDGDRTESHSITGQRELVQDFLKSMPEIHLRCERVDDGFSGVDFLRPAFVAMMEDIRNGKIDCVIVKDFSRFGRNYIEVGRYLENIFPFLGVRFISVNDHYDSEGEHSDSDNLIVPFKNLINDAYSRDISVKIRSQLAIKRKKGAFTGAFATYGYFKSPENKNQLVIDKYASEVVRDIFRMKLEGFSQQGIADLLNAKGELSPMEYKRFVGLNYTNNFKRNNKALWTAVAIGRILKNRIYTGVLEQGKSGTPNHKLKNRIYKPKEEWHICDNMHEPIINKQIFEVVTALLLSDTRIAPDKESVYVFSGLIICDVCGNSMIRKTVHRDKKYIYYICSTRKNGGSCTQKGISENKLIPIVLHTIKKFVSVVVAVDDLVKNMHSKRERELQTLKTSLSARECEAERYRRLKGFVYEDLKNGLLEREDYIEFNALYSQKLSDAEAVASALRRNIDAFVSENKECDFDVTELNRKVVVSLIEKIIIERGGSVDITFMSRDEYSGLIRR